MSLSDFDLDAVRAELQARRDRDRERLGALAKRPERGSAVSFGKRIGDGTSEAVSRLTDVGVGESLERELRRIERALTKLDEGTYGICDSCGAPISPGRLKAMPEGVLWPAPVSATACWLAARICAARSISPSKGMSCSWWIVKHKDTESLRHKDKDSIVI